MSHSTPEEDRITLTPISRPDPAARDNRRRRRTIAVAVLAGVVVVAGVVWGVVAANQGDGKPAKHKAVVPYAFGPYVRSTAAQSAWDPLSAGNTDPNKGLAFLSYNAGPDKGVHISVYLDAAFAQRPGDESDADWLSTVFGIQVEPSAVKTYDSAPFGGTIQCADIHTTGGRGFTECAWNSSSASITLTPTLGHHTVTSPNAVADLRAFLKVLKITER